MYNNLYYGSRSPSTSAICCQPIMFAYLIDDLLYFVPANFSHPMTYNNIPISAPLDQLYNNDHIKGGQSKAFGRSLAPNTPFGLCYITAQWSPSYFTTAATSRTSNSPRWTTTQKDAFWRAEGSGQDISESIRTSWRGS